MGSSNLLNSVIGEYRIVGTLKRKGYLPKALDWD